MTEAELEAIQEPARWTDVFDERSRAVLRLADAASGDSHALDADLVADLRSLFGEVELAELILVCGQANLNNRVGNAAKQLLGPPGADRSGRRDHH